MHLLPKRSILCFRDTKIDPGRSKTIFSPDSLYAAETIKQDFLLLPNLRTVSTRKDFEPTRHITYTLDLMLRVKFQRPAPLRCLTRQSAFQLPNTISTTKELIGPYSEAESMVTVTGRQPRIGPPRTVLSDVERNLFETVVDSLIHAEVCVWSAKLMVTEIDMDRFISCLECKSIVGRVHISPLKTIKSITEEALQNGRR
ncbi:hypothetical protein TWF192_003999 [Orbilia oligospora]|uniref:Uncharacterized protein n=1 Tax=Orbilia oligospora TaxID=2813651 RepID=A0A6G1MMY2_ORBOL|nr:hypothetical protein TWF191_007080 [Orbilia oligospora]KAF3264310.1 hypothetical protein TWF192_003999 [Orbilia oligospora]